MYIQTCILLAFIIKCYGDVVENFDATRYLVKYGYLPAERNKLFFSNEVQSAIKKFQKEFGLTETGNIDVSTKTLMNLNRCGVPDITVKSNMFSTQNKWQTFHLTYYIENYTPDMSQNTVEEVIKAAFQLWSDVSPFTFEQKNDMSADIFIRFAQRDHGDSFPFDGPGGTLGHAFKPPVGDTHFDDDEYFTNNTKNGVNLLWVAVHEFGHALGLDHSNVHGSIMYPMYGGYQENLALHQDDIARIRNIYGAKVPTTAIPGRNTNPACADNIPPVLCNSWRSSGYCQNNIRVQLECRNTCGKC